MAFLVIYCGAKPVLWGAKLPPWAYTEGKFPAVFPPMLKLMYVSLPVPSVLYILVAPAFAMMLLILFRKRFITDRLNLF